MNDADFKEFTKRFPGLLKGSKVSRDPLPVATEKQPPFIAGAFSPDGEFLALSGGGRIPSRPAIWIARVPSFETAMVLRGHQGVHALAWDPQTWLLASASNDYTTVLWDIEQGDNLFVCGGDHEPIVKARLAFGDDALFIGESEAFGQRQSRLLCASLATGKVETLLTLDRGMGIISITVDAATNAWSCVSDDFHYGGKVMLHRPSVASEPTTPPPKDKALARSPDGTRYVVADSEHVTLYDTASDVIIAQVTPPAWFTAGRLVTQMKVPG